MTRIRLRAPVIFLVLAAIAIPIELAPPGHHSVVDLSFDLSHGLVNVLGFVPVGFVLGDFGVLWAVAAAALMSGLAEASQIMMLYRDPSLSDFITNVTGAALGAAVIAHWKIRSLAFKVNRWTSLVACVLALALAAHVWAEKGPAPSARGVSSPGTLEADWKLDEESGRLAFDSSGNGLNGRFSVEPERVSGATGTNAVFDGRKESIDIGRSTALRLAGSMTITAWINSSSFPYDDAAIVSQLHGSSGYQLDTTIDKGARTIGFKLRNAYGNLMARYGATPLIAGTWYYVAGVYDARKRTLDVYLDGKLDNGPLIGPVTSSQHSSRWPVYIGRRSDSDGFGFAGLIRDVRIYSLALTGDEIAAVMRGGSISGPVIHQATADAASTRGRTKRQNPESAVISEDGDQWIPLMAASIGVLVAIACVGFRPSANPLLYVFFSFVSGLLLLPAIALNVPSFNLWLIPLVASAGGVSVLVSAVRRPNSPPDAGGN